MLPFQAVRDRMDARRLMPRGRRGRRINRKIEFSQRAHRQKRFHNRRQGKLAPSIHSQRSRAGFQTHFSDDSTVKFLKMKNFFNFRFNQYKEGWIWI